MPKKKINKSLTKSKIKSKLKLKPKSTKKKSVVSKTKSKPKESAELTKAYEDLRLAHEGIKESHMAIVLKLAIVAEYRDEGTGNHIIRISDYGCEVCKGLGMSEDEIEVYRFASPMHDIGKIAIPDSILKKKGKLTIEEFEIMKGHTIIGARMFDSSKAPILQAAADICRAHHEKWDGSGYPYGLKGKEIPLMARILALVDVFDALVSKRCYKDEWTFEETIEHIKKGSGKHFDPALMKIFIKIMPSIKQIYDSNKMLQSFVEDYKVMGSRSLKDSIDDEMAERIRRYEQ
ncbi:MAG: putative two-component system response regulator [Candidatus Omnitrophota bacterium]|jgi:putative two-component system response regulator